MFNYIFHILFLVNNTYINDIILGVPENVELLIDPIKVSEKGDTIFVLDQETKGKIIKKYTLDGFFIKAYDYSPQFDSIIFNQAFFIPTSEIIRHVTQIKSTVYLSNVYWLGMDIEPDSTIWLVGSCWDGDASWLSIVSFTLNDTIYKAAGYGPSGGDYSISSLLHKKEANFFFHVGKRYIYLIASEFLWQYDRQVRFVRKIGIKPNQCFKEPCDLAMDNNEVLYIVDFRLGIVWECRPPYSSMEPLSVCEDVKPETSTRISYSKETGLWINDIYCRLVKNIGYHKIIRSFNINQIHCRPGGTNFDVAAADSFIFVHYDGHIYVYNIFGNYLKGYQGTDYEGKQDGIVGLDNCGNVYMFKRGNEWGDVTFIRIDSKREDSTNIILPDSFQPHRMCWERLYRTGDTLYLYGYNEIYSPKGSSCFHGFYIFINDTLKYTISKSEFKGGLPERIIDFLIQGYGLIWIVDIDNRVVKRYRFIPE